MKYLAVIDTNVIISAMLNFSSVPGQIVLESLTGKITPLLNDEILAEYEEVLSRPKFHFSQNDIDILIEGIRIITKKEKLDLSFSFSFLHITYLTFTSFFTFRYLKIAITVVHIASSSANMEVEPSTR